MIDQNGGETKRKDRNDDSHFLLGWWSIQYTLDSFVKVGNTGYILEMFSLAWCFKPNQQMLDLMLWVWFRYCIGIRKMYFVLEAGKLAISAGPTIVVYNLQAVGHLV